MMEETRDVRAFSSAGHPPLRTVLGGRADCHLPAWDASPKALR
jgi:hypothetical protein